MTMMPPRARLPRSPQKAPHALTDPFPSQSIASAAVAAAIVRSTFDCRTPPPRDPGYSSITEGSTAHRHGRSNRRYSATRSTTKRLNTSDDSPTVDKLSRPCDEHKIQLPYDPHGCDEFTAIHGCYAERLSRNKIKQETRNRNHRTSSSHGPDAESDYAQGGPQQPRESNHRLGRSGSGADQRGSERRPTTVYEEALASVGPAILEAAKQESKRKQRDSDIQHGKLRDAQLQPRSSMVASRPQRDTRTSEPPESTREQRSRSRTHRKKPQRVSSALFDSLHESNISQDSSAEAFRQTVRDLSRTTKSLDDPTMPVGKSNVANTKYSAAHGSSPGKESENTDNTLTEQTTTTSDDSVDSAFPVVVCSPCESTPVASEADKTTRAMNDATHRHSSDERPVRQDPWGDVCFPFYVRVRKDPPCVDIEPMNIPCVEGPQSSHTVSHGKRCSPPKIAQSTTAEAGTYHHSSEKTRDVDGLRIDPAGGKCSREFSNRDHRNGIRLEPWLVPRKQPKPLPYLWSDDDEILPTTPAAPMDVRSDFKPHASMPLWSSDVRDEHYLNTRYDAPSQQRDNQLRYSAATLEPPSWISGFVFLRPHAAAAPLPLRPFKEPHTVRTSRLFEPTGSIEGGTHHNPGVQTAHVPSINDQARLDVEGQRFHTLIPSCWVDEFTRRIALRRVLHEMVRRSRERKAARHWKHQMQHRTLLVLMHASHRKTDYRVAVATYSVSLRRRLIRQWLRIASSKQRKRDALRALRVAAGIDVPPLIH